MRTAIFILTLSTFSGAGFTFAAQVFLARVLPPAEFGIFFSTLALVTLAAPLGGFGAGAFMLKVFGEEASGGIRWMRPILNFTFISCGAALISVYTFNMLFESDKLSNEILYIISSIIIAQALLEQSSAIFQLEGKYKKLAILQIAPHAMRFFLVIALWLIYPSKFNILMIAKIYLITAITTIAIGWAVIRRAVQGNISLAGHEHTKPLRLYQNTPSIIKVLTDAWPFGLSGIFYLIYFQSNIILVKYMLGNEPAAQYTVVITIMTSIYMLPGIIYQKALMPNIHIWANHDRDRLKQVYRRGNIAMLVMGLTTSAMLILLATFVVDFLFGKDFASSSILLTISALGAPLRFVAASAGAMLATRNNMAIKVNCMGITAIFNVLATTVLITQYGTIGAAYASVATELFLFILYFFSAKKFVFKGEQ